jgi:hypothetical protein
VSGRFGPGPVGRALPPELQRLPVDQGEDPPRAEGAPQRGAQDRPVVSGARLPVSVAKSPSFPVAVVDPDADPILADVEAEGVAPSIG